MNRKRYQGAQNDKERSMQLLIDAVGAVIETKGYTGLTATNIAKVAGLSRRLITVHFSSLEELIETYIRRKDYWVAASGNAAKMISENRDNNTKPILECLLTSQLDYFNNNQEMQKIVLWQISESTKIMKEICEERELLSQVFFALSDIEFKDKDVDLRAISALMVAGIYYLVLHAKSTDTLFCEIDLKSSEGIERIKNAIKFILEKTYV
ncbi:MAG: TetR/AcrR family transcriptional regulator [Sphingobacteriales bacterium]|nr:MAG: TetR/AcrR family transcriptional regulator [Sphingobacteriales bacterium]